MDTSSNRVLALLGPYRGLPREVYILFIARIINATGSFIFPLMTLILTKKIGFSADIAGIVMSVAGILFMLTSLLAGKLTDSFGRKKLVIIFTSLSAACYIIISILGSNVAMVPLLIAAGMLSNMAWPAQGAMIADLTNPNNRKATYSLFYMGMNIGFAVSPLIGGVLFEKHLRLLFIGDAITTLISTALIFLFVEETIQKTEDNMEEERKDERRLEGSTLKVLLSRPILIFYAFVMFGYNFVYSQLGFLYPIDLEHIYPNKGAVFFGRFMGFNAVLVIVLTPVLTALIAKFKDLKVIFAGGILYSIGFGMLGFVNTMVAYIASNFIITIGEIIVTTCSMPFVANRTPASHRGRINSVLPLIMNMGQTIGPLVMGSFIAMTSIGRGWMFTGSIMFVFSFFMLLLYKYDSKKEVS